jgi:hypothetical protein
MNNFKQIAKEWAEKTLKEAPQTSFDETAEQFKELMLFGSLLYAQNEKGEKVWLKRITGNENYEVKPVSVINGQIVL